MLLWTEDDERHWSGALPAKTIVPPSISWLARLTNRMRSSCRRRLSSTAWRNEARFPFSNEQVIIGSDLLPTVRQHFTGIVPRRRPSGRRPADVVILGELPEPVVVKMEAAIDCDNGTLGPLEDRVAEFRIVMARGVDDAVGLRLVIM